MPISRHAAACLLAILAAGCGRQAAGDPFAADGEAAETIECALAGKADFTRTCAIERSAGDDGLTLTIRHPDGGFRRLQVTDDGRGVIVADGAERAVVTVTGADGIEVTVGSERYRLPATVKGADASAR